MRDIMLEGCIAYQEELLKNAKLLGSVSEQVLIETTITYLKKLQAILERKE